MGIEYVNGNGELLRAGGRVMKNVTGLGLLAGSWGRLAILTEIALKVLARRPNAGLSLRLKITPLLIFGVSVADSSEALHERLGACLVASRWHGAHNGRTWTMHGTGTLSHSNLWARPASAGQGRAFQPQAAGVKRLEAQVKSALDRSILTASTTAHHTGPTCKHFLILLNCKTRTSRVRTKFSMIVSIAGCVPALVPPIVGDELDSLQGRIYLIKDMLENDQEPTQDVVRHLDRCLVVWLMTTCLERPLRT